MSYYDYQYENQQLIERQRRAELARAEQQRRYDQARAVEIGKRIGELESAIKVVEWIGEAAQQRADEQAYVQRQAARAALSAPAPTPTTAPRMIAPGIIDGGSRFDPKHLELDRGRYSSIEDPLCWTPGVNVRGGR